MSAATEHAGDPVALTRAAPARRAALRALPGPRPRAARTPFVVLLLVLTAGGLLGLLLLNTVIAQDAFRLHDLERTQTALDDEETQLRQSADALADPANLAARAAALGLRPAGDPSFLLAGSGRLLGAIPPGVRTAPQGRRVGDLLLTGEPTAPPSPPSAPAATPAPAVTSAPPVTPARGTASPRPTPRPSARATPRVPAHPSPAGKRP